jgi:hypothetical protein
VSEETRHFAQAGTCACRVVYLLGPHGQQEDRLHALHRHRHCRTLVRNHLGIKKGADVAANSLGVVAYATSSYFL